MKHLKTCVVVGSALLISLVLLALPTSPRTYFVLASPGSNDDYGESCIYSVGLAYMVDASHEAALFSDTGETEYISEGAVLTRIEAVVFIDNVYAATEYDAVTNTRVHVLVKDPGEGTVYDNILPTMAWSEKGDNCWWVMYNSLPLEEALVTGKYTVTITYEIHIEPE